MSKTDFVIGENVKSVALLGKEKWFARFQMAVFEFYTMRNTHTYKQSTNAKVSILTLSLEYA